jgi:hypothetical protein
MRRMILCFLLLVIGTCGLGAQGLIYELEQLYRLDKMPQYRDGIVREFSSYDRTEGNDDGFSGKYSFIRMEGDKQVLAEMTGPGVINRIHTPTPTEDTIEFYFDGETTPRLCMPFSRLFTGNQFPFLNPVCDHEVGGYYCYLPMPYNKSCKVLYRGKMLFWQLQYRTYPEGTEVKTFSTDWDKDEAAALEKAADTWKKYGTNILGDFYDGFRVKSTELRLNPGDSRKVFASNKGGRIIGIEVEGLDKLQKDDNRLILKAKWDGDDLWAIDAPMKDLFGYYFGERSMRSLICGSNEDHSYLYYPMPYERSASMEVELEQSGKFSGSGADIIVRVFYQEKPKRSDEGRFYAHWRRDMNPPEGESYVIAPEIKGKGHYVGSILLCQGHETGSTWYFEGDDRTYIDGELAIHGTGSEDFFNGGYYEIADRWDMAHSLPSHGCLGYTSPQGRTGAFRHYFTDKLSFEKNFSLTIEHGPVGNKIPVDYRSVAFCYSDRGFGKDELNGASGEYPQPGTVKFHNTQLQVLSFRNGGLISERMENADRSRVLILKPTDDQVTMVAKFGLPAPSGKYKLYYSYFRTPAAGEIRISQRQNILMEWKNVRADEAEYVVNEPVGTVNVQDDLLTITFYVRGGDPGGFCLGGIMLERLAEEGDLPVTGNTGNN